MRSLAAFICITLWTAAGGAAATAPAETPGAAAAPIALPAPRLDSSVSLEKALRDRRSIRSYTGEPLTLREVSQLLWAAQGITGPDGKRTAPSAGALYPLEVYLAAGRVDGLLAGVYKYQPRAHALAEIRGGDPRADLAAAARGQRWVGAAPAAIVIAGVYERSSVKYGQRAARYVHLEAGHAAENVCLQAVSLGVGTVTVGAFDEAGVGAALRLEPREQPLCILPVGRVRPAR
jgi:SagB-type dehydrogenase family enzyme